MHSKTFNVMPPKRLTQLQILASTITNSQSYPNHTLLHLRSRLSCTQKHSMLCLQNVLHNSKFSLLHLVILNCVPTKPLIQLQILSFIVTGSQSYPIHTLVHLRTLNRMPPKTVTQLQILTITRSKFLKVPSPDTRALENSQSHASINSHIPPNSRSYTS